MGLRLLKPVDLNDFIDSTRFAKIKGLTKRQLDYRLKLKQVHPHPVFFGKKYVYDPEAVIIITPRPLDRKGGRPKGTTVANGARPPTVKGGRPKGSTVANGAKRRNSGKNKG